MSPEEKITQLGLRLPGPTAVGGNYVHCKRIGDLLYLSGKGPKNEDGSFNRGRLGADVSVERGYLDARLVGLHLLAAAKGELGQLVRVRNVVKVFGMVNATPEFGEHPKVINGCSDLFVSVFGQAGQHARSAVGMGSLPNGMTVEIEAVFQAEL